MLGHANHSNQQNRVAMRSKRAKEYISDIDNQLYIRSMATSVYIPFDVERAIELAEQDAVDRAKKAFCKATCNDGLYCEERNCHDMRAFIESLNNGGQSNGD